MRLNEGPIRKRKCFYPEVKTRGASGWVGSIMWSQRRGIV